MVGLMRTLAARRHAAPSLARASCRLDGRARRTGLDRLRAGLPAGWRVGDKTGTGANGAANDVAIAWPPGRPPILIACYQSGGTAERAESRDRRSTPAVGARCVAAQLFALSLACTKSRARLLAPYGRGSRADGALANPVRSGRKQP